MKKILCLSMLLLANTVSAATIYNAADPAAPSGAIIRANNDNDLTTYCDFSKAITKSVTNFFYYCVKR